MGNDYMKLSCTGEDINRVTALLRLAAGISNEELTKARVMVLSPFAVGDLVIGTEEVYESIDSAHGTWDDNDEYTPPQKAMRSGVPVTSICAAITIDLLGEEWAGVDANHLRSALLADETGGAD